MKKIILSLLLLYCLPILSFAQQVPPEMIEHQRELDIKNLKNRLLELDKISLQEFESMGICMELANMTDDAYYLYRVLAIDSTHLEANYQLAAKLQKTNPEKALSLLQKVIDKKENYASAYNLNASIYLALADWKNYETNLKKEIKYARGSNKFYATEKLAKLYLQKQAPKKALQIYADQLSTLNVYGKYHAWLNRAKIYMDNFQNYPKAIAACDSAIVVYKAYTSYYHKDAVHLRGMALWKNESYAAAIEDWSFAEQFVIQYPELDLDSFYQQIIQEFPDMAGLYYVAALHLEQQAKRINSPTQRKQAIAYLDKAINLGLKNHWVYFHRGICKKGLKDYQAALKDLNECIAISPNFSPAFLHRGEVKYALHLREESQLDYKMYSQLRKLGH